MLRDYVTMYLLLTSHNGTGRAVRNSVDLAFQNVTVASAWKGFSVVTARKNVLAGTIHLVAAKRHVITSLENVTAQFCQMSPAIAACAVQDGLELIVLLHTEEIEAAQTTLPVKVLVQHITQHLMALDTPLELTENSTY